MSGHACIPFTITNTNRHLTWALRTLPTYYATASALSAGCNALVIQVLHAPDTLRPICRRVRHTDACPTFGEQNRNRVDPCRRETLRRPVIQINITIVARQLHARVGEPLCRRSPSSSHLQTKRNKLNFIRRDILATLTMHAARPLRPLARGSRTHGTRLQDDLSVLSVNLESKSSCKRG